MTLLAKHLSVLGRLRAGKPLVHNLTSATVANFTANVLLALGASPAMVESPEEIPLFVPVAQAVSINLGSLSPTRIAAIRLAVATARTCGTPWVLDPVGAGGIAPRTGFARELLAARPAAIRGNASEILALAGESGGGRGVDSGRGSEQAIEAARRLASETGAIVAVTGVVDYATDGQSLVAIEGGHVTMTRVTGMGCAASAMVAACLGAEADRLLAVSAALDFAGQAGARAGRRAEGPGSFATAYLDELAALDRPGGLHDIATPERISSAG